MIMIPMAGLSSRFTTAGYKLPKYMLEVHGKTLFEWSLISFAKYFDSELFIIVILKNVANKQFASQKAKDLGILNYKIIAVDPTEGQAHSVYLGLMGVACELLAQPITIFNIDTIRLGYTLPALPQSTQGYLEVFRGEGSNWSYVKPEFDGSTKVVEVAEKNPISDLACTGIYYFAQATDFIQAYEYGLNTPLNDIAHKERYVAPLYNYLISNGKDIRYNIVDKSQIIFCGVPDEYEAFKSKPFSGIIA